MTSTKVKKCDAQGSCHSVCSTHQKKSRSVRCHGRNPNGSICSSWFNWTPPYLRRCIYHREQIDPHEPCYFLKLPTELRQEIFSYLMPTRPIDTLFVYHFATSSSHLGTGAPGSSLRTMLPTPMLGLFLGFNREVYKEVKDVFYRTATFIIDVGRDGVTMCGRRILAPTGPNGYSFPRDDQLAIDRFIQNFAWTEVRNYSIRIESWMSLRMQSRDWDDEVEIYDLRDYVAVVVSGVLAKARQLCNLQVRVFFIEHEHRSFQRVIRNTKHLIGPFERLRNVRDPRFLGIFHGQLSDDLYGHRHRASNDVRNRCVTPPPRDLKLLFAPDVEGFDVMTAQWQSCLAIEAPFNIIPKSPMTNLFVEFKAFYHKLFQLMPHIGRTGRNCPLHRARVARENEDIVGFRAIRTELLEAWYQRLAVQRLERQEVDVVMQRMLGADTYPPPPPLLPPPPRAPAGQELNSKREWQQARCIDLTGATTLGL